MPQPNDLSRSLVALDQNSTIIAVVELSQSSWLVAGMLPGIERQPHKKLEPSPERLLALLHRWRDEAVRAGRTITRIALAFEAGRDGFWLARWLDVHGVEAHVIHASSIAVSREHRRAKTDRLDTELLKRGFLGWLRGERGHCSMARVPTIAEEDAKRPNRERDGLVGERTRIVNRIKSTLARLGIRNFKPTLRKAAERLATVHTPEGMPLPPNTLAELQRDMARLGFVVGQIREIEEARQKRGPDSSERPRAQPVGNQAGAGHRRVWSGVAPPEHSGGRPSRSRSGTVSPGAGGGRLCTGWGARLGQSHRLPILGLDPAGILRRRRPLDPEGNILLMGIIEEAEGVQNIRDILRQVRGIGAIWAGPGDMSVSMGLRGQASHPAVQENLLRVLAACKEFGVPCATGATADDVAMRLEQGFRNAPSLVHRGRVAMTASLRGLPACNTEVCGLSRRLARASMIQCLFEQRDA